MYEIKIFPLIKSLYHYVISHYIIKSLYYIFATPLDSFLKQI